MKKSENCFQKNKFSHIYVEKNILQHPVTNRIISKFKSSEVVPVEHYKDVFNKSGQLFYLQKRSMKLILAEKKEPFLYRGSDLCDSFGHDNFYYTTSAMNCVYNCEYCYLQGLYNSGNLVIFVNLEETFEKIEQMSKSEKIYICISYDTDLLAIENLTGFVKRWIEFASRNSGVVIELRTKSDNFFLLSNITPIPGFIFSWSISPDEIISRYENGTPMLESRLTSMKMAIEKDWKVRLCIDPVIYIPDYKKTYSDLVDKIKNKIDINHLNGVSTGVFRVPKDSMKKMRNNNPTSSLLAYPFVYDTFSESYTYGVELKDKLILYLNEMLDVNGE